MKPQELAFAEIERLVKSFKDMPAVVDAINTADGSETLIFLYWTCVDRESYEL